MDKYNKLKTTADEYSQVNKSRLHSETAEVMHLKDNEIEGVIDGFCNVISMYSLFKAEYDLDIDYKDYLKKIIDNGYINNEGYFNCDPEDVAHMLGLKDWQPEYFDHWADVIDPDRLEENSLYKLKIKGHFIACMIKDKVLIGFDTMRRGNPFNVAEKISHKEFLWLMKI